MDARRDKMKILTALCYLFLHVPGSMVEGDDKSEIREQIKVFQAMYHNRDLVNDIDRVYTSDVYAMQPAHYFYHGKPAMVLMQQAYIDKGGREVPVHDDGITVYGNIAVQLKHYEVTWSNGTAQESGKGIFVWRKDSQTEMWKVMVDIWNKF